MAGITNPTAWCCSSHLEEYDVQRSSHIVADELTLLSYMNAHMHTIHITVLSKEMNNIAKNRC